MTWTTTTRSRRLLWHLFKDTLTDPLQYFPGPRRGISVMEAMAGNLLSRPRVKSAYRPLAGREPLPSERRV